MHPEPLTEQDTTIASLKLLISNLTPQCSTLSDRISTLSTTAREAVKSSNRHAAQSALRSRKVAETTYNQRSSTLHQLEEVYANLERAVDQVEIVRVMESSATALRSLDKQIGGVERVEDIVEDLRAEMGKVDEVTGVIQEPLSEQAALDEGELDDELEALEKEEKDKIAEKQKEEKERVAKKEREEEEEAMKKRLEGIPDVPKVPEQAEGEENIQEKVPERTI